MKIQFKHTVGHTSKNIVLLDIYWILLTIFGFPP
jgi:hypothetical protein